MLKHIYILLFSTFFVGFLTGVYIFIANRAPIEPTLPNEDRSGFEIVVDMYGGCDLAGQCASYRLRESGGYIYITRDRDQDNTKIEGIISKSRVAELRKELLRTDLRKIQDSTFNGTCPAAFDGLAYKFEIQFSDDRHVIDTCVQDIEDKLLFEFLIDYFEIFSRTHRSSRAIE